MPGKGRAAAGSGQPARLRACYPASGPDASETEEFTLSRAPSLVVLLSAWTEETTREADRKWPRMPVAFSLESRAGPSAIREITDALGSRTEIETVPIPADCADGFNEAYYARPEMLLDRPHPRPAGIARTHPALPDSPHLAA